MSKFKVGDTLTIRKDLETDDEPDFVVNIISKIKGKEAKIISIDEDGDYHIDLDDGEFVWYDDDFEEYYKPQKTRGFEIVSNEHRKHPSLEIQLPTRGSKTSAGYDFYSPIDIEIQPHQKVCIWSDVKAYMREGEVLLLFVRSSIGINKGLRLSNSTGVIDSDYFSNKKNDGNIGIALHNYTDEIVKIEKGERVCQGVFVPFLVADSGNTDIERSGGIGSTGTK